MQQISQNPSVRRGTLKARSPLFVASTFPDFFCFNLQTIWFSFFSSNMVLLRRASSAPQSFQFSATAKKHLNLSLHLFITATFTHFSTHFSSPLPSICDCAFSTTSVSAELLLLTFATDTLLRVFLFYSEGNFHKRVIIEVLDRSWAYTAGVVESLL